jgi:hypothetical protein
MEFGSKWNSVVKSPEYYNLELKIMLQGHSGSLHLNQPYLK